MSRKTWVILAIVIVAVGAIVGIALSRGSSSPSDLTLPIITWNETTLSTLEGTPVVLNFWSTSCYWCKKQLPYLENVARQGQGDIEVIATNIAESHSRILSSLQTIFGYQPTMTIALDTNGAAFVDYCLAYNNTRGAIPFTLFVDGEGVVQYVKIGAFASEEALWNTLHDVLGITTP
jgi:thiol-disulfide isomerase/thioredoxin